MWKEDIARELKKLWNMKVTIVPIMIGAFGTITKGLLKGLEDLEVGGRVGTIQITALLRTARILRRLEETCFHSLTFIVFSCLINKLIIIDKIFWIKKKRKNLFPNSILAGSDMKTSNQNFEKRFHKKKHIS